MIAPDLLETTVPAAAGATRRLTTKEKVKADLGITDTASDTLIDQYIDQVSDAAARYANLAEDNAGNFPTLGAETLRATWYGYNGNRCGNLLLPWRVKWAVTTVTEGGTALVAGTDYRVLPGGELQRISSGYRWAWYPERDAVVTFTAGWTLPAGVPPSLEAAVIDQVKYVLAGRARDPALRSLDIPGVSSETYNVAGGSSIGEEGLLSPLERVLDQYRRELI
jgi:hypothetical protein